MVISAWTMTPAEQEPRRLSKNIFAKAIHQKFDRVRRLPLRRKVPPISAFDTLPETSLAESLDGLEFRVRKIDGSTNCNVPESECDSCVPSDESSPSLPGSVESDKEDECLYTDACFDQPELKRIAKLVQQRACQNVQEGVDNDEFCKEKTRMKALVKSFVKEAASGLNCRLFRNQALSVHAPAKLFLDASLTMTVVGQGEKGTRIPLIDVIEAYSSADVLERFPDSPLNSILEDEYRSGAIFIQYRAPGFPESWVYISVADEASQESCVWSINVLQKFAELEQQRSLEHSSDA